MTRCADSARGCPPAARARPVPSIFGSACTSSATRHGRRALGRARGAGAARRRSSAPSGASASARAQRRHGRLEDAVGIEHRAVHADALHGRALGGAHFHGAAGAAADRARHEFLERHLARHPEAARERGGGLRASASGRRRRSRPRPSAAGSRPPATRRRARSRSPRSSRGSPAMLASRLGTPQSSSSGMQAIEPCGHAGTRISAEGRARNGNGTSEPMQHQRPEAVAVARSGARPGTPSAGCRRRRRAAARAAAAGCGTNGRPIGPEHAQRVAGLARRRAPAGRRRPPCRGSRSSRPAGRRA